MRSFIARLTCSTLFVVSLPSLADQAGTSNTTARTNSETKDAESNTAHRDKQQVAWDEFSHRGEMVWACRNIYSGSIVNSSLCADQPKADKVWPDKKVPADYTGGGISGSMLWPPGPRELHIR
jgi:hypothetical protein